MTPTGLKLLQLCPMLFWLFHYYKRFPDWNKIPHFFVQEVDLFNWNDLKPHRKLQLGRSCMQVLPNGFTMIVLENP